jgi:hypothetical protein
MAIFKKSAIISDISGSVSGTTFLSAGSNSSIRARGNRSGNRSNSQARFRSSFAAVTSAWRTLTDAQRLKWYTQKPDDMNGYTFFCQVNTRVLWAGGSLLASPNIPTSPISPVLRSVYFSSQYGYLFTRFSFGGSFGIPVGWSLVVLGCVTAPNQPRPSNLKKYKYFCSLLSGTPLDSTNIFNFAVSALGTLPAACSIHLRFVFVSVVSGFVLPDIYASKNASPFVPLLLDLAPFAVSSCGLSLLNSDYDGPCFEVRRSSDDTVLDIGFNGTSPDIDTLAAFCVGSNGFITKTYDQSGNGLFFEQQVPGFQPQIVIGGNVQFITASGSGAVARLAMSFDGRFLEQSFSTPIEQPASIVLVHRILSGDTLGDDWNLGYNAPNTRFLAPLFAVDSINSVESGIQYWMLDGVSSQIKRNNAAALTRNTGTNNATLIYWGTGANLGPASGFGQVLAIWDTNQQRFIDEIFSTLNEYYKCF